MILSDRERFEHWEALRPDWYAESKAKCLRPEHFDECPARRPADGQCIATGCSCWYPCIHIAHGPWPRMVEEHDYRQRIESDPTAKANADGRLF